MTNEQRVAEYPLSWPNGLERTQARSASKLKTGVAGAIRNVRESLIGLARDTKMPIASTVISTNVTLTNTKPDDPGVAVWFYWDDAWRCYAIDVYRTIAENLQAIHHVIEADRTKVRHAGVKFFRSTFRTSVDHGLMITGSKVEGWRDVLGQYPGGFGMTPITRADVTAAYRRHAKLCGPKDEERLRILIAARDAAMKEIPA